MSYEEGDKFARENGMVFLETSAKTALNVEEVKKKFFYGVFNNFNRLSQKLHKEFMKMCNWERLTQQTRFYLFFTKRFYMYFLKNMGVKIGMESANFALSSEKAKKQEETQGNCAC